MEHWNKDIFTIQTEEDFNHVALKAFQFQFANVSIYNKYCISLNKTPKQISHYSEIPFLPIEFFKTHEVIVKDKEPKITFYSSGTTGIQTSKHKVVDPLIYEESFLNAFELYYGNPEEYCILALLPSYLERGGSSLVYMAERLIKESKHEYSGFYLDQYDALYERLVALEKTNQKTLLIGVTYALLDLAEQFDLKLENTTIMETGGMKGRRKELIKEELHQILYKGLGVQSIHSEYGMTELLSQGYSYGEGVFSTPPWMKVLIRDTYDPFTYVKTGRSGGINVIDLANINSCCFIETKDLGKQFEDNTFTILGRFDNSDIRGCNLMVAD